MRFKDEGDLVRSFCELLPTFPRAALSPDAAGLLVIGSEVHLPTASAAGGGGSADILAIDDHGELWLIEAKLSRNPQVNPWYLFGNQLSRYAHALTATGLTGLHVHLQHYAYGRRAGLRPPSSLAQEWRLTRDLEGMLKAWLSQLGRDPSTAGQLVASIGYRIRTGQFVMAALVDGDHTSLSEWSTQHADQFQTAVIVVRGGTIAVVSRTPHRVCVAEDGECPALPPFDRIPQSFALRPHTIPLVLNETALQLWQEIVEPRLIGLLGPLDELRCDSNSTSFGYCIEGASGVPFFLRIGRGDDRVHRGRDTGRPGAHSLKLDLVFKWACSTLLAKGQDERQLGVDSLYRLSHGLVFRVGYRFKATDHEKSIKAFNAEFARGLRARTLLLERGGLKGGHPDYGTSPSLYQTDASALEEFFRQLERELPADRPLRVVPKPTRRGDYSEGPLEGCQPSIDWSNDPFRNSHGRL